MFNIKDKEQFLNFVRRENLEDTAVAYGRIFITSEELETELKKDLYNFTIEEIERFFREYRTPKTKTASRTVGRIITKYINWAIKTNKRTIDNKNPLDVTQNFFNKFVPEEKTQYLTVDEVTETLDYLVNDQDAVIVALLFNGVQGKEASEIRNLTIKDVDFYKEELTLTDDKYYNKETGKYDDKAFRTLNLEHDELHTLRIIRRAYKEDEYRKKNGEMEYAPNVKEFVTLPTEDETPYIVKTGKTQKVHYGEKASQYTVYNRIDMMRTLEGLSDYSDKLTTKNIVRSGMIFETKRLLETEGGELDSDKLKRVCDKFNVKNHWAVRDFINMEVIESLYGKINIQNKSIATN